MKKIICLAILAQIAAGLFAQDINQKNVPAVVVNAFHLKFANAEDIDWEMEKGIYHVDFELNNKDHDAWLDDKGKMVKHEQELWESEIPEAVMATVRSKCEFFDLEDAEKMEEKGDVTYYIGFDMDHNDYKFWIDHKGKLIRYQQELKKSEIPFNVMATISSQYAGYEIRDAEKTEEGRNTTYDIGLRKSKERIHIILSQEGKVLDVKK